MADTIPVIGVARRKERKARSRGNSTMPSFDVTASNSTPGAEEPTIGRWPSENSVLNGDADMLRQSLEEVFDTNFYRQKYQDIEDETDALRHYFEIGWAEGRDPNAWFSTRLYLTGNPDVAARGFSPLLHWLSVGRAEGRKIWPAIIDSTNRLPPETVLIRDVFDRDFYRNCNSDVTAVDPFEHFCLIGWREKRDPASWFSTAAYLDLHPDVAQANINPFIHYMLVGQSEGRQIRPANRDPTPDLPAMICQLDDVKVDAQGILRVSGWAASLAPIQRVTVLQNGRKLGQAQYNLARADVAAVHPNYPNATASGFLFRQELVDDAAGDITVVVESMGNIVRYLSFPLTISPFRRRKYRDISIRYEIDSILLQTDGTLTAAGWAFAGCGIERIDVAIGTETIGAAVIGQDRPDVGNLFPSIPSARTSGFRFTTNLKRAYNAGEHNLRFAFHASDGEEKVAIVPTRAQPIQGTGLRPNEIKFHIDSPIIVGGTAVPAKGSLTLAGWAVATSGIRSVEVLRDGVSLGNAYFGMRRRDIHRAFPNLHGSLLSGFAMAIPAKVLTVGPHNFEVIIRARSGNSAQSGFTIEAEPPLESPSGQLVTKLKQTTIDLKSDLLRAQSSSPCFVVGIHLRSAHPAELQRARGTISQLSAQTYNNWRGVILGTPRAAAMLTYDAKRFDICHNFSDLIPKTRDAFVLLLRAGDTLAVDALLEFALGADNVDFVYCDDRRYDPKTQRVTACYKPDWSPDLLLSSNYIGRAWAARATLLRKAKISLDEVIAFNGYDLVLRLTEKTNAIGHVAQVLIEQIGRPNTNADMRALRRALRRTKIGGTVQRLALPSVYRVQRHLRVKRLVSIIIPTRGTRELITVAIEGIRSKTAYRDFEIVCLDNIPGAKSKDLKVWLRQNADNVIELSDKFNWSRFNNIAARAAKGEYLLFLNDDIEVVDPQWLHALLEHGQRPEVGVVGAQLLYPDGKVQHGGIFLSHNSGRHAFRFSPSDEAGPFGLALVERNVVAVTGACMLTRRDTFVRLGGFNESHSVVNNDLDYCLRSALLGQRIIYTPHARLTHHELASRSELDDVFDRTSFKAWNRQFRLGDSYFSRHLSRDYDDYTPEPEPPEVLCAGNPVVAKARVKRILAVKLDHIGDFITALPAFRRLRERFPDAEITALVPRASFFFAESVSGIDRVIEFNFFHERSARGRRKINVRQLHALRATLEPLGFDLAIDLRLQPETRPVLQSTGAKWLAGYDRRGQFPWLDITLEWEIDNPLTTKRTHVSDSLVSLVDAVAASCESSRAMLPSGGREEARKTLAALSTIQPFAGDLFGANPLICLHPGGGAGTRQWPAEHFAALIDLFAEGENARFMLIGSPDEVAIAEQVLKCTEYPTSAYNLIGKTGMRDLRNVLLASDLFIGNNSGPHHFAAALGVPTVGIHSGVVDAAEWGPLGPTAIAIRRKMTCSPCYLENVADCHRGHSCMRELYPGDVYRTAQPLLALGKLRLS